MKAFRALNKILIALILIFIGGLISRQALMAPNPTTGEIYLIVSGLFVFGAIATLYRI